MGAINGDGIGEMINPHNYEVCAVGTWVEALRDDIPDLCQCPPSGQDHLTTYSKQKNTADRIAVLWNLTRHIPTEDLAEHFVP